jgi:hypothetical protein
VVNNQIGDQDKRQAMNEFQAILVEIIFFVVRFGVPAAIIIFSAIVLNRYFGQDTDGQDDTVVNKG